MMPHPTIPTRGERNNNAGNLERNAIKWQGMAMLQPDPRFITFDSPVMGIRALAMVLLHYFNRDGLATVSQIIACWAPPSENNTEAYIQAVAHQCRVGADDPLDLHDHDLLAAMTKAIIFHENGRCIYSDSVIDDAVQRALA